MVKLRMLSAVLVLFSTLAGADSSVRFPGQPVLECIETCQRFDGGGDCQYRTSCVFSGDCVSAKSCARFDSYGACKDERTRKICGIPSCPGVPQPLPQFPIGCEEVCQKRNSYGDCVYTSRCEIRDRCVHLTTCERFDSYGEACVSEQAQHACY